MSYQYLGFFMGLFGSLHCVAMCGPLVMALPVSGQSSWKVAANRLIYQAGRILTYGIIGFLIGYIGNSIAVKGWQQVISIATGAFLIGMGLFAFFSHYFPAMAGWQQRMLQPVIRKMGYWLYRPGGSFMAGALNGLLPCGMVYMALAAALNVDSLLGGGTFMVFFGLGTLPMMAAVSIFGSLFKKKFSFNMSKWLPTLFLIMGIWFLLRGANLNIPFLSPVIYPEGAIMCN